MKTTSAITGLVLSLLTSAALAGPNSNCGGDYKGNLEMANELHGKALDCVYNGVEFSGVMRVSIPRCMGGKPLVELITDENESSSVISIRSKIIRGVAYTYAKYYLETVQSDLEVTCVLQK